jgi:tRNA(Ile2) C34 agmatinyltransferase TiaS
VEDKNIDSVVEYAADYLEEHTLSKHTSMAVFQGLKISDNVREFGLLAKENLIPLEDAERTAKENGIKLVEITGSRGKIGALAAIGCFDLDILASGLKEDFDKQ